MDNNAYGQPAANQPAANQPAANQPAANQQAKKQVCVCHGPKCGAGSAREIAEQLSGHFSGRDDIEVKTRGCTDHCSLANNVVVNGAIVSRLNLQNCVGNVEKALAGDVFGAGGGVDVDVMNLPDDKFLGI